MSEAQKHPIISGVSDFYFIFFISGMVLGLLKSLFSLTIPMYTFLIFIPVIIIFLVIYYRKLAPHQKFVTPGESLGGRVIHNEIKIWVNPYNKNRWFLFFTLLVTIVIYGNSWDSLLNNEVLPIAKWFSTSISLIFIMLGAKFAGQGKKYWIFITVLPSISSIIMFIVKKDKLFGHLPADQQDMILTTSVIVFSVLIVLAVISYIVYNLANKKHSA